jgi:hypothetical protein
MLCEAVTIVTIAAGTREYLLARAATAIGLLILFQLINGVAIQCAALTLVQHIAVPVETEGFQGR